MSSGPKVPCQSLSGLVGGAVLAAGDTTLGAGVGAAGSSELGLVTSASLCSARSCWVSSDRPGCLGSVSCSPGIAK